MSPHTEDGMTEVTPATKVDPERASSDAPSPAHSRRHWLAPAIVTALLGAGAGVAILWVAPRAEQVATSDEAVEPLVIEFTDATGAMRSLSYFRGKTLLVNFWATWCTPCQQELPALDRLQAKLGSAQFQVVALLLDNAGVARAGRFLLDIGNTNLTLYIADLALVRKAVGVLGLPTTLFVDSDGHEVHRVVGPAEWDSPEMIAEITTRLGLQAPQPHDGRQ